MKIGKGMSGIEHSEREESGPGIWSSPYSYLAAGLGFAVAALMVIATAGVLVAGIGFVILAAVLLGVGVYELQQLRGALPRPVDAEREVLSAIRDKGGRITPAEAATETSLTVREADEMLSELAAGGYLMMKGKNGALFYSLAGRSDPELEGWSVR